MKFIFKIINKKLIKLFLFMKVLRNYKLTLKLYTNELFNTTNKSFCYKYIPYNNLKFENINFYTPVCKIYEANNKKSSTNLKLTSALLAIGLIFNPLKFNLTIPILANIIFQTYIYLKLQLIKKNNSMSVKIIYLIKNGQQILMKTQDDSIHIIHIKDIVEYIQDEKTHEIYLRTDDKEFKLLTRSNKIKIFIIDEILSALSQRRCINTSGSYTNYHRLLNSKYLNLNLQIDWMMTLEHV